MARDVQAIRATAPDGDRIQIDFGAPLDESEAETALMAVMNGMVQLQSSGGSFVHITMAHSSYNMWLMKHGDWERKPRPLVL